MNQEEQNKKMGQIMAKAWADDAFKQKLLANATATLREEGVDVPEGVEVRVVENTDKVSYAVLPLKPRAEELSDKALDRVAGGSAQERYIAK
jgi:hypothetical protein